MAFFFHSSIYSYTATTTAFSFHLNNTDARKPVRTLSSAHCFLSLYRSLIHHLCLIVLILLYIYYAELHDADMIYNTKESITQSGMTCAISPQSEATHSFMCLLRLSSRVNRCLGFSHQGLGHSNPSLSSCVASWRSRFVRRPNVFPQPSWTHLNRWLCIPLICLLLTVSQDRHREDDRCIPKFEPFLGDVVTFRTWKRR
jgi:hypothetical protein